MDVMIDADGYWWRSWSSGLTSMAPTNPDNSPIPRPTRHFRLVPVELIADIKACANFAILADDRYTVALEAGNRVMAGLDGDG